jgi:hypothetical protein
MSVTRTRRVLDRRPSGPDEKVRYVQEDDDVPGAVRTDVAFDYATYVDMGSPDVVTVTIEPGDLLN